MEIKLNLTFEQILALLLQLSPQEKLKLADRLRAQASTDQWRGLSKKLPDVPEIGMEEIVDEVKAVRKLRSQR